MPKGVYERTAANRPRPRTYPPEIVTLVRHLYLEGGLTVAEVQRRLPAGFKAQRIIERHIPTRRPAAKRNQAGDANASWKGAEASYSAVHLRLTSWRGKAANHPCHDCGKRASDWSYQGGCPDERSDPKSGCTFTTDLTKYVPRCHSCHTAHDRIRDDLGRFASRGGGANVC